MSHPPKTNKDLWKRIKYLIDKFEAGNVSATAKTLGASQRGLSKIYNGETTDPHASIILAVASRYCRPPYNVDLHWFITGRPSPHVEQTARTMAKDMLTTLLKNVGTDTPPSGSPSFSRARG